MSKLEQILAVESGGTGKRIYVLLSVVLSLMAFGCDKKSQGAGEAGLVIGKHSKTIAEMAPGDVIVSVNGDKLTRAEYDEMVKKAEYVYRLKHPESKKADLVNYVRSRALTLVPEYVTKQLLLQEAQRRALKPAPEEVAYMESLLAGAAKKEGKTVEQFLKEPGREKEHIRKDVNDQALIRTLRQAEFGERLTVTEEDINKSKDLINQYNRMCEATNRLVQAKAEAVCQRLREGADFSKVADEVSQAPKEPGGIWGEFVRAEIEDAQIRNLAFTLPVGSISDPVDTQEGMIIIKVLDRVGVDSPMAAQEAKVKLARIVFLLGEFKKTPADKVIRTELEKRRIESLQRDWVDQLFKRARVEYPNGTNFWSASKQGKLGL